MIPPSPHGQRETHLSWQTQWAQRKRARMDAESPSAASFRASGQSPRDPDPDSRPPMSLLLSAALSFFPLWGSSLAAARLAAASGSGSTRRLGSPATRALGFPALRPRGVSEGGPAGGEEEPRGAGLRAEARLGSASFPLAPCHRLGWLERARKGEGWSCSLVLCQALWGDMPPPYT